MHEKSVRTVELRRYQRIVVPEGLGIRVSGCEGGKAVDGIATVIGLGGMFCRTQDKLPPGTALTLRLTCADTSFETKCSVRHANEQGMGVEFTGFTPENKQRLENLLIQFQT